MRKIKFANEEYYHIYNRGVDKREIFCNGKDYVKFMICMKEFNNLSKYEQRIYIKNRISNKELNSKALELSSLLDSNLVNIVCYCLNPNHYHLLLKQLKENGIKIFMHKLGTGYTNYFNQKYARSGALFQGRYKAIHVDTNEYILWLSGYINGNAEIHKIDKAENYKWCGYPDYIGKRNGTLCDKKIILSQFRNVEEYKRFVEMAIAESRKRKNLKKYFIEEL